MRRFFTTKLDNLSVTSQGFLKAPAYLTRIGVFTYRNVDGSIRKELRHPDDVFNLESLETLKMVPLTDDHPSEFISPENFKQLSVGYVSEAINIDADKIGASVVVSDKTAIDKVMTGKVQLSCGYSADLIEEPGIYDGMPYDFRQTNIRYNHVALVNSGRAGPTVRLRVDGDAEELAAMDVKNENEKGKTMMKYTIDGVEYEIAEELYNALMKKEAEMNDMMAAKKLVDEKLAEYEGKMTEMDSVKKDLETKCDTFQGEVDALKAKTDELAAKVAVHNDSEIVTAAVKARLALEKKAVKFLPESTKLDEMSDTEIMVEVIKSQNPEFKKEDKSEVYVQARFDAVCELDQNMIEKRQNVGGHLLNRKTEDKNDSSEARKKSIEEAKAAYKAPLSAQKKN